MRSGVLLSCLVFACGGDDTVRALPDAPTGNECPCEYLQACVDNKCVAKDGLAATVFRVSDNNNTIQACVMQTRSPASTVVPTMSKDGCDALSYPTQGDYVGWEPVNAANLGTATLMGAGAPIVLPAQGTGCFLTFGRVAPGLALTLAITGGADFPAITSNLTMPAPFTVPNRTLVRGQPFELVWTPGDGSQLLATITVDDGTTTTAVRCRRVEDDGIFEIPGELTAMLGAGTATLQTSRSVRDRDEMIAGDRVFEFAATTAEIVELQ